MVEKQSLSGAGVHIGAVAVQDLGDRVIAIRECRFQDSFQYGQQFVELVADVFSDYAAGEVEQRNVNLISFGVVLVRTLRQFMDTQDDAPNVDPPLVIRVFTEGQTTMVEDVA